MQLWFHEVTSVTSSIRGLTSRGVYVPAIFIINHSIYALPTNFVWKPQTVMFEALQGSYTSVHTILYFRGKYVNHQKLTYNSGALDWLRLGCSRLQHVHWSREGGRRRSF